MLRIIIFTVYVRIVGSATMTLQRKEYLYGKWAGTDILSGILGNPIVGFKIVCGFGLDSEDCGMTITAPLVSATFAKHIPSEPFLEVGHLSAVPYPAANRRPNRLGNRPCKSN